QGQAGGFSAMTCHEARELFWALVDEALEDHERSAVDAHLTGCGDCRRELDRFQRTVAFGQALPAERAPAGFVERVVARAQPEPWPARLLRGLFVPWATNLPLESVAIVLVGGLAVCVLQRTPEPQRERMRMAAPPPAEAPGRAVEEYLPPPETPPAPTAPTPTAPTPTAPTPTAPTPTAPTPAAPTPASAAVPAEKA